MCASKQNMTAKGKRARANVMFSLTRSKQGCQRRWRTASPARNAWAGAHSRWCTRCCGPACLGRDIGPGIRLPRDSGRARRRMWLHSSRHHPTSSRRCCSPCRSGLRVTRGDKASDMEQDCGQVAGASAARHSNGNGAADRTPLLGKHPAQAVRNPLQHATARAEIVVGGRINAGRLAHA